MSTKIILFFKHRETLSTKVSVCGEDIQRNTTCKLRTVPGDGLAGERVVGDGITSRSHQSEKK